jgi:23S rRNA (uracil1939-C5)-methyltransferase
VPFEFSAQKLVYGGDALGYAQGRTVLVPYALPGERLEVEAVRTAKGVVHARPLRILAAAPERVDPPCPYYGRCGGCQYQHLKPEIQTTAKREILRETLRRIGKISWAGEIPLHAANPWNYRNQAQLKVATRPDGQVSLGFFEAQSHRLSPLDTCLILSPRLNAILGELGGATWSPRLAECREVDLLADDRDERVVIALRGNLGLPEGERLARDMLAGLSGVVGVAVEGVGGTRAFGEPRLEYSVGEFRYRTGPGAFFQASRFLLPELVAAVTAEETGTLALDIFAGVGLFTLPLARRFTQVVGVEASVKSAADLRANAQAHSLENIRAVSQTAFDFLRRFAQAEPDLVVLDPPRSGVGAGTLKLLQALRPRRLHYVSCSPPTLARDLGCLRGYELNSLELFDFFPQTFHIESLAKLIRRDDMSR